MYVNKQKKIGTFYVSFNDFDWQELKIEDVYWFISLKTSKKIFFSFSQDQDGDGVLVFEEFKNASLEDWLLMEAFGQCLPDYKVILSYF